MGARETLAAVGAAVPEVLLPAPGTDLTKFAVVACDQYSAQPEYWDEVEQLVGDAPSALHLMLPEAWLGKRPEHEAAINPTMKKYLADGTLRSAGHGLVFLHRATSTGVRRGLVVALDLEQYDFTPGSKSLIRATEKTIVERLPTRVAIRRNAPLEMPHIMVLINDKENRLMGWLDENVTAAPPLYDFKLMQKSGVLKGWLLRDEGVLTKIGELLAELRDSAVDGMLYAMGDGNHSMAAAKAHWDSLKETLSEDERRDHPARYAMVELVNLYDEALWFEPIHRLLIHVDREEVLRDLAIDPLDPPSLQDLQPRLDDWLAEHPEAELEYIHGDRDCINLGKRPGNLAIVWKSFDKDTLFRDVAERGVLVRKSFSMGAAPDKRFYLECRKIR